MLRKLMKYEWLSTSRKMFPFYILILSVSIINGVYFRLDQTDSFLRDMITILLKGIYTTIIVSAFLFVIYSTLQRFYQNIYGQEGYLYHTLPVKSWQNILAKLSISVLWVIGTVIVLGTGLSVIGIIVSPNVVILLNEEIRIVIPKIIEAISLPQLLLLLLEVVMSAILGIVLFYLKAYSVMGLGQTFKEYKILMSVIFYIIFQIIENSIITVIVKTTNIIELFRASKMGLEAVHNFHISFITYALFTIIFSTIYFSITKYSIDKKLNLQ